MKIKCWQMVCLLYITQYLWTLNKHKVSDKTSSNCPRTNGTNDDASLTCYWVLAAVALLGHVRLVAVHAVNVALVRSEASSCQRFTAGFAHETLRVPRLVLVADPSGGDGLGKADWCFVHKEDWRMSGSEWLKKEILLVPACSGSISWRTSCRGRERSRCPRPWPGNSECGLAACIQCRWSIPRATPCSCTPRSEILSSKKIKNN